MEMLLKIALALAAAAALTEAKPSHSKEPLDEGCECWMSYEPFEDDAGATVCQSTIQRHQVPCNSPRLPECECNDNATSITLDDEGLRCTQSEDGVEVSSWSCENPDEWVEFFHKHPELDLSVTTTTTTTTTTSKPRPSGGDVVDYYYYYYDVPLDKTDGKGKNISVIVYEDNNKKRRRRK